MKDKKKMSAIPQTQWEALVYGKDISRNHTTQTYEPFTIEALKAREDAAGEGRSLNGISNDLENLIERGLMVKHYTVTAAGAEHQQ